VVVVTVAILLQPITACAEEKSVEQLERAFTHQKDHRRRARLAMDILDARLNAVRAFVSTGTMLEERAPVLSAYDAAVSRLDEAVHAAAHVGTSKRVEVGLRRHMKELEQIRANVSAMERPLIEALAAHVVKIREAVLYSIMAPKK
jgi:hypothetical protein